MSELTDSMRDVLKGRYYATLATLNDDGSIHLAPVWYLFEDGCLFVGSSSASRKIKNLASRPEVSLMIDVRKLGSEKWVSASGTAELLKGEQSKPIHAKILRRYLTRTALEDSRVGPGFESGDDVIIKIIPHAWRSWDMKTLDDEFFDGLLSETPEKWFLPLEG
jgi:PPOX class probable F420-dependent enzyme